MLEPIAKITAQEAKNRGLIGTMTHAVYDYEFVKQLKSIPWAQWMVTPQVFRCRPQYLDTFHQWILSSRLNSISGLERFQKRDLINGTTQTFDEAYFVYAGRRLRFFRGEYAYHRRMPLTWSFIEDEPLAKNDYVIVSAPFCTTGDVHPQFYSMLDEAYDLQVPVIVDSAYFGTCHQFSLDVSHPAIESVSFSLSKGLGLGDIRSGIRFSNLENNHPIRQQNNYDHTVLSAARIGLHMLERLSPDFIPTKYAAIQKEVCAELGLRPTLCMHLALADNSSGEWEPFNIDGLYYRVGLRNLLKARSKGEA